MKWGKLAMVYSPRGREAGMQLVEAEGKDAATIKPWGAVRSYPHLPGILGDSNLKSMLQPNSSPREVHKLPKTGKPHMVSLEPKWPVSAKGLTNGNPLPWDLHGPVWAVATTLYGPDMESASHTCQWHV